jgi:biopolymer transport protein ExbD
MINRSDRQVFLRTDGGIDVQELLDVMDRLKAAGVEKVGVISKLPGEQ